MTGLAFVDKEDGWAYGFGLWATHDGGRTWSDITFGAPHTSSFADSVQDGDGRPVALFGLHCAAWMCRQAAVYSTAPGTDDWRQLPGAQVSSAQSDVSGLMAVYGRTAWLLTQQPSELLTGPDNGKGRWKRLPLPDMSCGTGVNGFAVLSAQDLVALCESNSQVPPVAGPQYIKSVKSLYLSTDGGRSWRLAGHLPYLGGSTAVMGGSPHKILAALYSGPLYSSSDLGRRWGTALKVANTEMLGGMSFSQVALGNSGFGYAVPALMSGLQDVFYVTTNGAATWRQVKVVSGGWDMK